MPFKLYPPGTRRKRRGSKIYTNRHWYIRVWIGEQEWEFAAKKARDRSAARSLALGFEREQLEGHSPEPGEAGVTFRQAANAWNAEMKPSESEWRFVERLIDFLGDDKIASITRARLIEAADERYGKHQAESRNRQILTPAATVLHYAAHEDRGWAPYRRIAKEKTVKPPTRSVSRETAHALIASAHPAPDGKGDEARKALLFLLWIFKHGDRVSDPLRIDPREHIDMQDRTFKLRVGKTRAWETCALDEEVWTEMANHHDLTARRLFPWHNRWQVYKALAPIVEAVGVKFTPHMARHSGASWRADEEVDIGTIMDWGHWKDIRSVRRYTGANLARVRRSSAKLGKLG